jgi:3-methyl-2-oxobutanoate hydroxymethyltransferase
MAGLRTGRLPKFVKTYGNLRGTLLEATKAFASDVVSGSFPDDEHSYR